MMIPAYAVFGMVVVPLIIGVVLGMVIMRQDMKVQMEWLEWSRQNWMNACLLSAENERDFSTPEQPHG